MAGSKKVVATRDFVSITDEGYRVVRAGEQLNASEEVVKANPSLFEEVVVAEVKRTR